MRNIKLPSLEGITPFWRSVDPKSNLAKNQDRGVNFDNKVKYYYS